MRNRGLIAAMVFAVTIMFAGTGSAAPVVVESSTDTLGATIITWESSFEDLDYTIGATILLTVNWTVDAGSATYDGFALRHYTPKSKNDPAIGNEPIVTSSGDGWVTFEFLFSDLHYDEDRMVDIGNGHFKVYLLVDEDGDGTPETVAGFGTNIHVEDPQ